jgi:hypothetical protein
MAFYADTFTFDGVSSDTHFLYITTPDSNEKFNVSNYKSDLIKSHKQSKFLPKKQYIDEPNILQISVYSETALTRENLDTIEQWLYRSDGKFRKLTLNQNDMVDYHYNCRLASMEAETFGNKIHTLHFTFETDSIYAWSEPSTLTYINFASPITFVNESSENEMSPTFEITMNSSGGTVKIEDTSNTDTYLKSMELNNMQANEVIIINSELGIISSNLRTNILGNFTYVNFMRFSKGEHILNVTGNIAQLKITYSNGRKIGV